MNKPQRIVILGSGAGSNANSLMSYVEHTSSIEVVCVMSNKAHAGILDKAKQHGIKTAVLNKALEVEQLSLDKYLTELQIDWVILAGFLKKIPETMTRAFPNKILNIHPSLLPKYGGKGMYGAHVHKAVVEAGEKETGITIHYVNAHYDDGAILFQTSCNLSEDDSFEDVEAKIRQLEQDYFAPEICKIISHDN